MKKQIFLFGVAVLATAFVASGLRNSVYAVAAIPQVYQAAGPNIASIQGTVDQFRAALGANNGNTPGPIAGGRREINWDGGGSTATSLVPTPFDGFLVTRGARFTTAGTGFVQAPVSGLVTTFGNASYATAFQFFSPVRLFSAIGSNVTDGLFFLPGGGGIAAATRAFGAVFTDVDRPDGRPNSAFSTKIEYFDARGSKLYTALVPPSPGDAGLSFMGVVLTDPLIARVRITSGNEAPSGSNEPSGDVVVMDDFVFGEPVALPVP